ncbi:MAG: HAD hydrolase-like protein [Dehalococcoidales bacterium]|nr:HAD hydrolase-like protein [Dehalococcoidales bacterium]
MINPSDVNLIIFDMDGTIIPSLPAVYESIKRAFLKLGWPVSFSPEEINYFFGITTASAKGSLYEFITPPDSHLSIDEVRDRVCQEYEGTFRDMAQPYPGVKETLSTLRKRGYKLAQYTNASAMYLDIVMSSLDIREYFDYVECIQHNNLTKTELVKKMRGKFGGLKAAVVGDRSHDIEAARDTDSLSIGVLFGYGGEEPKEADITINKFDDLLAIFDRRLPIFDRIKKEIEQRNQKDRAFVIGINGIDGAGKTGFAAALETYLQAKGHQTQLIHLDDFHNPKAIRYSGKDQVDNYYTKSFNIGLIVEKLLLPIKDKKPFSLKIKALDPDTDKYEVDREYSIDSDTIIIFEGVFLFRKDLSAFCDYKIYLDIRLEESKRRAIIRDSTANVKKYDVKYLPAQVKYMKKYPPTKVADIIIDNTNWEYPNIKQIRE